MALFIFIPVTVGATQMRGNLNLSFQGSHREGSGHGPSTFHQIANIYLYDRLFYSNDLTLGAYVFHSRVSNRERGDFRVRYSAGLVGHRYNFYSSFSPFTTYRPFGAAEKTRIFVASLNITPRYLPPISSSFNSNRRFTTDDPQTKSGINYSWNVGAQLVKSFGSFRGVYQHQRGKVYKPIPQTQTQQTVNFAYDVARQIPMKVYGTASYSFTGSRFDLPPSVTDYTRTHNAAGQASRAFGPWFSVSASTSGRFSEYERGESVHDIRDFLANGAANLKLRSNLALVLLRGYNSSENRNDTTSRVVNDHVSISGLYTFGEGPGNGGRLSISRGLYFESALGRAYVTSAAALFDMRLYRDTDASINLGLSHNDRAAPSQGKYSMTRTIDIVSRPTRKMTLNMTYNSSLVSKRVNFADYSGDNFSVNYNHVLKWYFNYSLTFTRSSFRTTRLNVVNSLSVTVNYRVSNNMSLLSTYARRDLGRGGATLPNGAIDESISSQLSWLLTRRANLRLSHSISGLRAVAQSQTYGCNLVVNF